MGFLHADDKGVSQPWLLTRMIKDCHEGECSEAGVNVIFPLAI